MAQSDHLREHYGVELEITDGVISLDDHRLKAGIEMAIEAMDELVDRIEELPPGVRRRVRAELAGYLMPEAR